MIEGWQVLTLALGYVGLLFAVAWFGDRVIRSRKGGSGRPVTYALSLAVYCTSWTFFGSVGLSAASGYDFIPVYLGPILIYVFGVPLILRIVRIAKSQNLTSVADFIAARYGKSQAVAAIATVVSVLGALPYIALQLKAAAISIETLLGPTPFKDFGVASTYGLDTALVIALALAAFAVLFGTRHIDATEHQDGLMLAIAAELLVKLAAFLAVGIFVIFAIFGGPAGFIAKVSANPQLQSTFAQGPSGSAWLTVTILSMACIILLPRQFHVTVVENNNESEIRRASWLFPTYLVLINLFVVPIAIAGLLYLPDFTVAPDMFVLALPMWAGADTLAMIAFIGGLSAATAMVIVEFVALAIMICNGLLVPWLLRRRIDAIAPDEDMSAALLLIRRVAIFAVILLGYMVHRALGQVQALAAIGLIAFAAIAQLAPAFFIGLIWRRGTARGAIAGILLGFGIWAYTLLLPWVARAGWLPMSLLADGPYGFGFLRPQALFYLQFEPLTHGVLWSLLANLAAYIFVSLLRAPEPIERIAGADLRRRRIARLRTADTRFPPVADGSDGRRTQTHGRALPRQRAGRALVRRVRDVARLAPGAGGGSRRRRSALHRASVDERHRCGIGAAGAVAAAAARQRLRPVGAAPPRRCLRGASIQPRSPPIGARSGTPWARRVRP